MRDVLCDNTDIVSLQANVFLKEGNQITCGSNVEVDGRREGDEKGYEKEEGRGGNRIDLFGYMAKSW